MRKHIKFRTELVDAKWDDSIHRWRIQTSGGKEIQSRYMVTALGLLSKQNYPAYPGIDLFKGELYHTGNWPQQHDFRNKRVGVIGNGSTGGTLMHCT
jgi:cyclohexanone monooxygenase